MFVNDLSRQPSVLIDLCILPVSVWVYLLVWHELGTLLSPYRIVLSLTCITTASLHEIQATALLHNATGAGPAHYNNGYINLHIGQFSPFEGLKLPGP